MSRPLSHRVEEVVRAHVPRAALPAMVRVRTARARSSAELWNKALRHMHFVTGVRAPDTDLDDLTGRYLHMMMWRSELRWHPELLISQRVENPEHLLEARDRGRGVIVNFMHHGFYDGLFASLAAVGVPVTAIATPSMFKERVSPWLAQQHRVVSMGAPALNAELGTAGVLELLGHKAAVGLATDVPSTSPMTFLGRRVRGASGAARIALRTGAPIVMVTSHRGEPAGSRPTAFLRVAPLLDPADFETPDELLTTMVRHHERAVLAWPEASDQPLTRWQVDEHLDVP